MPKRCHVCYKAYNQNHLKISTVGASATRQLNLQSGNTVEKESCPLTENQFPRVKRLGRGAEDPPPSMLEAEPTPGPECGRKDYVNEKIQ